MPSAEFSLPGSKHPLPSPATYLTGLMRNFREASTALGAATDALVVRVASNGTTTGPDYQIQTLDGEDIAAFSGETHELLHDDITVPIQEERLLDVAFTLEDVKDWLNTVNGEGLAGGEINPGLSSRWKEEDASDPRD